MLKAEELFAKLDKQERVLTGLSALCWSGTSLGNYYFPQLLVPVKELDNIEPMPGMSYYYTHQLDTTFEVSAMEGFPHIKIPSKERAFVELIKYDLKAIDEGMFCDALYDYIHSPYYDEARLRINAEHFHVEWGKVEYWLDEAKAYTDM